MSYFVPIKTAITVFPFIALLFSIPFILHQYHKYGAINFLRVLIIYSFILYILTMYFLVILPLPSRSEVVYQSNMVRLIPFGFIKDIIKESSLVISNPHTYLKALKEPCIYTVIFNIIMTIPLGMYLRYYFKCSFKKTIFLSFLISLFFEVTQVTGLYFLYPHPYRVFDVDDLIMNTLGGTIGYFLMGWLDNFLPTREEIDAKAFQDGETVSGLRRLTIFLLDLFLYVLLTTLLTIIFKKGNIFILSFILYYIFYPFLHQGSTFGSKFLKVRLSFKGNKLLSLNLRILFLFVYYIGTPLITIFLLSFMVNTMNLQTLESSMLYLILLVSTILFYLINIFCLIKNKTMFYDNFFKVTYISTIKKESSYICK